MENLIALTFFLFQYAHFVSADVLLEPTALAEISTLKNLPADFGKLLKTFDYYHTVISVAGSPNGDIAAATTANEIVIRNSDNTDNKRTISEHNSSIKSMAFNPKGDLATAGLNAHLYIWSSNADLYLKKAVSHSSSSWHKVVALNDSYFVSASGDCRIVMHDAKRAVFYRSFLNSTKPATSVVVLKNEEIAGGYEDGTIRVWNWKDNVLKRLMTGHSGSITALVQLPNGDLVSGSADKTIRIWNSNDGTLKRVINVDAPITALAALRNNYLASSTSTDLNVKIWDTQLGLALMSFLGHTAPVNDLSVLPNGNLASAGDRFVKIWKTV